MGCLFSPAQQLGDWVLEFKKNQTESYIDEKYIKLHSPYPQQTLFMWGFFVECLCFLGIGALK